MRNAVNDKSYLVMIFIGILFLSNIMIGNAAEGNTSGNNSIENESACTSCHNISSIIPARQEFVETVVGEGILNSNNFKIESGGADCVSCHDTNAAGAPSDKRIDVAALKQGVHGDLNHNATNSTVLSDLVNKACWACHGDGTEPLNAHPLNYNIPYSCENCHNATANLGYTNSSIIPDISIRKVFEHIQPPYYQHISSTINSSNADCRGCHNNSKTSYSDSGLSLAANVSHYASRTNLVNPSINCSLCHKNAVNASNYWANMIRHPAKSENDSFCHNCHNTTAALDLHSQPLTAPVEIHIGFDWQNDDNNEVAPIGANEACMSCHGLHNSVYKQCEDCHIENKSGPVQNDWLRSDINDTIPRVYAHTNLSEVVNVPNQSSEYGSLPLARTFSSCYSSNGTGTCHGVSYSNISAGGGFYAFRTSSSSRSSPYHTTQTLDRLPETANCVFCHKQTNATIRKTWGDAGQITDGTHDWYTGDNSSECWKCHVITGIKPQNFHSDSITGGGGSDCISCHSPNDVNISKFARHANLNTSDGQGVVSNFDCWTCHYRKDMNRNHVYLCESCHANSSGIVNVTDPSLIMPDFWHGMTTCKSCHAPKGYHLNATVGPLGAVESVIRT